MYTRSAIFAGKLVDGKEAEFFRVIEEELLPIWKRMPHVQDVRLYRPEEKDDAAPDVILVQQIDYPTRESIDIALSSDIREEAVQASKGLEGLFQGQLYHYIYKKLTP